MIAFWFKFKESNDFGLVVGEDLADIFWEIDAHGNPYNAQIKPANLGGSIYVNDDSAEDEYTCMPILPMDWDEGWEDPTWPENIYGSKE